METSTKMEMSPTSDDGDALVADMLQPSASPNASEGDNSQATSPNSPARIRNWPNKNQTGSNEQKISIEVPLITGEEDYELLPGHSTVHRILRHLKASHGVSYHIQFKSGDKEVVGLLASLCTHLFSLTLSDTHHLDTLYPT
jgi:hypothetical protein